MKRIFSKKNIITILVLLSIAIQSKAYDECCYDPCANWYVQVKGGVAPIVWRNRGCLTAVQSVLLPSGATSTSFNDFVRVGKFSHHFKLPWTVGFEVGYSLVDCINVYGDFQYRQAKGKHFDLNLPVVAGTALGTFEFNKYKSFSGYIGVDYLSDLSWCGCTCNDLSYFIGIKVGFTRFGRLHLDGSFALANIPGVTLTSQTIAPCFKAHTVLSAGGRVGLDYCFCENLSLVVTAEFLAQCGRHFDHTIINLADMGSAFRFGSVGSELVFPITVGLRYRF